MDYFFTQAMTEICEHSLVAPGYPLHCLIIVNPAAGGFVIKKRWERRVKILKEYQKKARANPKRQMHKNMIISLTEGKGSAVEITKSFVSRAEKDHVPFYLIISAGGDGTHLEIMLTLYDVPAHIRRSIAVLKLPMGTGNDGSDGVHLNQALDLLIKPTHIEYASAVQLITKHEGSSKWKGPFLAFNIVSIGLDAFVSQMTNTMKEKFPGDSYRFWVDVATLSYERKYKVDYIDIKAFDDKNNEIASFSEKFLLFAMGVSGRRTYGSQQHILPDDRNVCGVKQMSFLNKLSLKGQFARGKHIKSPKAILLNAHRLEITCRQPILAQMDGEAVLLQPDDFPAIMEITPPVIPLLKFN